MIRSIRFRLAALYTASMGILCIGFAWFVDDYLSKETLESLDRDLQTVAHSFSELWMQPSRRTPAEILAQLNQSEVEVIIFDRRLAEIASNSREYQAALADKLLPSSVKSPDSTDRPNVSTILGWAMREGEAKGTVSRPSGEARVYALSLANRGPQETIAVIRGLGERTRTLASLRRSFLLLIPTGLAATFGAGLVLAARALDPVGNMAAQAARIGAETLHERLPGAETNDELGHLAATFNRLLDRVENAFVLQRRFMAEASHELRTPISVVRGEADLALSFHDRKPDDYRDALTVIHGESVRMTRLVDDLFLLARADAGQQPLVPADVDLSAMLTSSVRSFQTIGAARKISVVAQTPGRVIPFRGDETLLKRLVGNLLDNAIKYGRSGGTVTGAADSQNGHHVITIKDDGPGIPPDARARIFDRFFRGPNARSSDEGSSGAGAGLGLAISRWIAEAHGGRLVLASSDEKGTVFQIELPAS